MADPTLPFRPGTISWNVLRRPEYFLGGPRALLLQLAEPGIAAGVADHSDFSTRMFDRLQHTIELMAQVGLGDPADSERAVAEMDRAHRGVRGSMQDGSDTYDADDPELRLWVLATLIATVLDVEEVYVGEFDEDDRRRYYEESLEIAKVLGVDGAPPDLEAFRSYMSHRLSDLEVTDTARDVAGHVLYPRVGPLPPSAFAPLRLITADLLPAPLRNSYGMELSAAQRKWLLRFQALSRAAIPRLPRRIRTLPLLELVESTRDRILRAVPGRLNRSVGRNRR